MKKVEEAQRRVDKTKSLMESSIASMTANTHLVETKLVPSAVELAIEAEEAKMLAQDIEKEEKCRRCRIFCFCFACKCCRRESVKY